MSFLLNILWFVLGCFLVAFFHVFGGVLLCITLIGLPFAVRHLKMTRLAILPFGFRVVEMR